MGVYAFTDLHGDGELFDRIMKDFKEEDDKLYFLGDSVDRGPDGFRIMEELLKDSRVTYLMGNHEHMMVGALLETGEENFIKLDSDMDVWFWNGGEVTYNSVCEKYYDEDSDKLKGVEPLIETLRNLPLRAEYKNKSGKTILLSHAGYNPWEIEENVQKFVWDRNHFLRAWDEKTMKENENIVIVHGHTPMDSMLDEMATYERFFSGKKNPVKDNGSLVYCGGHKINIDAGTYRNHMAVVLDLDTLEPKVYNKILSDTH